MEVLHVSRMFPLPFVPFELVQWNLWNRLSFKVFWSLLRTLVSLKTEVEVVKLIGK